MMAAKSLLLFVTALVISLSAFGQSPPCRDFLNDRLASLSQSRRRSDALYSALREKMAHKLEGVLYVHNSGIEFYGSFQRAGADLNILGVSLEVKDGRWVQRRTALFVAAFWRVIKDEMENGTAQSVTITATEIRNPLFDKMLRDYGFQQGRDRDTLFLNLNSSRE